MPRVAQFDPNRAIRALCVVVSRSVRSSVSAVAGSFVTLGTEYALFQSASAFFVAVSLRPAFSTCLLVYGAVFLPVAVFVAFIALHKIRVVLNPSAEPLEVDLLPQ